MKVKVNLITCYSVNEFFLELIRDDQILIISIVIILFFWKVRKLIKIRIYIVLFSIIMFIIINCLSFRYATPRL